MREPAQSKIELQLFEGKKRKWKQWRCTMQLYLGNMFKSEQKRTEKNKVRSELNLGILMCSSVDCIKKWHKIRFAHFFSKMSVAIIFGSFLSVPHRSGWPVVQWWRGYALHAARQVQGSPWLQGPFWLWSHQSCAGLKRRAHGRIPWAVHSPGRPESTHF